MHCSKSPGGTLAEEARDARRAAPVALEFPLQATPMSTLGRTERGSMLLQAPFRSPLWFESPDSGVSSFRVTRGVRIYGGVVEGGVGLVVC